MKEIIIACQCLNCGIVKDGKDSSIANMIAVEISVTKKDGSYIGRCLICGRTSLPRNTIAEVLTLIAGELIICNHKGWENE